LVVPDIARWVGIEKPALVAFWDLQEPCQHAGAGNMIVGLDAINRGDGLVCRAGNLYRRPPCPFRWTRQTATGEMHFGAGWRTVGLSYGSDDAAETEEARRCLWHRALGKELADLDELVCDGFVIQDEAEGFGSEAGRPWCHSLAGPAKVAREDGPGDPDWMFHKPTITHTHAHTDAHARAHTFSSHFFMTHHMFHGANQDHRNPIRKCRYNRTNILTSVKPPWLERSREGEQRFLE